MNFRYALRLITIALISCAICIAALQQAETILPALQAADPGANGKTSQTPKIGQPAPEPVPVKEVPLSRRLAEYHISVQLDNQQKKLLGEQTITWKNPSNTPVSDMYFHLYPNAFESKKTTFMRESGGRFRNEPLTEESYGSMKLLTLKSDNGESLLTRSSFVQPDDGNVNDHTLMKLRLPDPVPPQGEITLSMSFEVQLPRAFARMGYVDDFVMAGQWFPKVSAYETKGTRGRTDNGWNLHQYHGNSEFYSDFGIYNVRIQVPSNFIVAATGFPAKPAVERDGSKIYQFYADDVHDFAWAASPNFIYAEEPYSAPAIPGVRIKLYLDPRHEHLKERYFQAAKSALENYSKWYGEYPYSTLSVVVPPAGGDGASGMEYPTLVTGMAAKDNSPGLDLERTLVHEIGHQYWYGIVATNEFEEAWLDEGLTSYAEDKVMEAEYGVMPNLPIQSSYITGPEPLKQYSWSYRGQEHYAENVYMRAKLVLLGIEKQVGAKTMNKIMKTYYQRWKFKHPSTADLQRSVEQVTKKSWKTYFQQYVYGGQMADFSVDSIHITKGEEDGQPVYENIVLITKRGGDYGDVPIVFHFADGTTEKKLWNGEEKHVQYTLQHTAPLEWVSLDPSNTIVLENRKINNYMKATVEEPVKVRWNLGIVKIIETVLGSVAW